MAMTTEIHCESCLWVGETLTPTEALSPDQREALALWLKEEYLNELCRGRAVFTPQIPMGDEGAHKGPADSDPANRETKDQLQPTQIGGRA